MDTAARPLVTAGRDDDVARLQQCRLAVHRGARALAIGGPIAAAPFSRVSMISVGL
jgi:hypothetical protein